MNNADIFAEHRTKSLFLLVGTNPLPNYVSALLLAKPNGTIYLLHSRKEKASHTEMIANFLEDGIKKRKPQISISSHGIDEVDYLRIETQLKTILNDPDLSITGTVGLNYTSGTKPMAIHVYNTLKNRFKGDLKCSYLDARQLAFYIEDVPGNPYPANNSVQVSLEELAALHGYQIGDLRKKPKHETLVIALSEVHETKAGANEWFSWRRNEFRQSQLPTSEKYPALQPVIDAFDTMCDGYATPSKIANQLGFEKFSSCTNWFKGPWLEELALMAIIQNVKEFGIKYYGIDLKPRPKQELQLVNAKNFQLDVAAMIGYQLFAVSCIASTEEGGETKKHLLEAYVRARQLGGDEARVGLVTCVADPQTLQNEINRDWHTAGKIQVFGQNDLLYLGDEFREWFATANQ